MNSMTGKLTRMRQRGISLITTLVMLVAVMVLGLSAILASKSDFMLSGNLQFQSAALGQAEATAVLAEQWLAAGTNYLDAGFTTRSSATPHLYPIGNLAANGIDPVAMNWGDGNSTQGPEENQRYLIELLAKDRTLIPTSLNLGGRAASGCNRVNVYRIIAQGGSGRGASKFVQSIYSRLSC
jgi:Tfp pilus assembly protein PilX